MTFLKAEPLTSAAFASGDVLLHVILRNAAFFAGAAYRRQIYAKLTRNSAHRRARMCRAEILGFRQSRLVGFQRGGFG